MKEGGRIGRREGGKEGEMEAGRGKDGGREDIGRVVRE